MTKWEESAAGVSVKVGGKYRMKSTRAVLVVRSIDREAGLLHYDLENGETPSACNIDTFERQIQEEVPEGP